MLTIVIRNFRISTNTDHEICNREMYEKKSHLVPVLAEDPLLEQLIKREGVKTQTDDEQGRVGNNRDDLCFAKYHVLGQAEVGGHKDCA